MFKQPKRHGAHLDIALTVSTKGGITAHVQASGTLTLEQSEALVEVLRFAAPKTKEESIAQGLDTIFEEVPK
jgi:hypothetical protein